MLSAAEIKEIKFSKSFNGYKQEEVEILLDRVESDYAQFERIINGLKGKIEEQEKQIQEFKASQSSIQNVLLSSQRLADRIVNEAKEKSEEIINNAESNITLITAKEKELSAAFELKAQERKNALEAELSEMVEKANRKAESITKAAEDSVERQQILFDKIKMEISAFKASVTAKYKEHLEILSLLPDTVPMDPVRMAKVVSEAVDKEPDVTQFLPKEEKIEEVIEENPSNNGFTVADIPEEELKEEF